jgi:hypothetical protein
MAARAPFGENRAPHTRAAKIEHPSPNRGRIFEIPGTQTATGWPISAKAVIRQGFGGPGKPPLSASQPSHFGRLFMPEAVEKRVRDVRRAVFFGHDGVEAL